MQVNEFKKVLGIAIVKERQILELYKYRGHSEPAGEFTSGFTEILISKQHHLEILDDLKRKDLAGTEIDCLPDFEVANGQIDIIISSQLTQRDVIIMGMKLVNELCKIYNFLGQVPEKSEISNLFRTMAQEELHHKTRLESEYDAIDRDRL